MALVLFGCGSELPREGAENPGFTPETSPAETAMPVETDEPGIKTFEVPVGFPKHVAMTTGDWNSRAQKLEVLDLFTGGRVVVAEQDALVGELSTTVDYASIVSPAISVDGLSVTFAFGYDTWQLLRVPIDGSSQPEVLVDLGSDFLYDQSPDGRWRVVSGENGLSLRSADGVSRAPGAGVPLAYPPASVAWSPDGTELAVVEHYERGFAPPATLYAVDPESGALSATGATVTDANDGLQWFDSNGEHHVLSRTEPYKDSFLTALAVDTSNRFVVGVIGRLPDGASPNEEYVWWAASDEVPDPHPIDLGQPGPSQRVAQGKIVAW